MPFFIKIFNFAIKQNKIIVKPEFNCCKNVWYSTKAPADNSEIPKNVIQNLHSASTQVENGIIYDKKPFKVKLVTDKTYSWCLCGHSKNQPFCDGSHKNPYVQIKLRPVRFKVSEEKDYWLCNCKQTSNRPFCDGTHKREDIQAKR
ncbi:uncharacterized protein [Rhodnius prolixus]